MKKQMFVFIKKHRPPSATLVMV